MFNNNINHDFINRFLRGILPVRKEKIIELERYAAENDIPICIPEVANFLNTLISSSKAQDILEIGSAIGYSALNMAMYNKNIHITTIEKNPDLAKEAAKNLEGYNASVLVGDALEILPNMDESFDFIFLDAAKAHYSDFLPDCFRMLKTGGLLVSDNVLYKGMIATDDLRERRKITIIKRMRQYLDELMNHPGLITSIVPLGDGLAVSVKREIQES